MKKIEKNKKILIQILGVFVLILVVIGTTYAAFTFSKLGSTVNSITTGTITMTYTESVNGITLTNAMPISDSVGKTLSNDNQLFDFTVKSNISGN